MTLGKNETRPKALKIIAVKGSKDNELTEHEIPLIESKGKTPDSNSYAVEASHFSNLNPQNPKSRDGIKVYAPSFINTAIVKSSITFIDGNAGVLRYRGYDIAELAEKSTFLEVAYLLIHGNLPSKDEFQSWHSLIMHHTFLHLRMSEFMGNFNYDAHPMGMFVSSMAALSTFHPDANPALQGSNLYRGTKNENTKARNKQIVRILGKAPTIAAATYRHRIGRPLNLPKNDLGYAENFLYLLDKLAEPDYKPHPKLVKALDVLWILHADHELNCSTATMRMIGSSLADPYSAIAGAAAALYGPLHGGANEAVLRMLEEISSPEKVPEFVEKVNKRKATLMGFGHRVYKNYDPRAKLIQKLAMEVFEVTGREPLVDVALALEKTALQDPWFKERKLYPNVDFYSGLIYKAMGFPTDFFPVLFAIPRVAGWLAHWKEGLEDPNTKIWRPLQIYVGEDLRNYSEIENRSKNGSDLSIYSHPFNTRSKVSNSKLISVRMKWFGCLILASSSMHSLVKGDMSKVVDSIISFLPVSNRIQLVFSNQYFAKKALQNTFINDNNNETPQKLIKAFFGFRKKDPNEIATYALRKKYYNLLRMLIEEDYIKNILNEPLKDKNWKFKMPLVSHLARDGNLLLVALLAAKGTDMCVSYNYPFKLAADGGYLEVMKYLSKYCKLNISVMQIALKKAAYNGHINVLKHYIDIGKVSADILVTVFTSALMGGNSNAVHFMMMNFNMVMFNLELCIVLAATFGNDTILKETILNSGLTHDQLMDIAGRAILSGKTHVIKRLASAISLKSVGLFRMAVLSRNNEIVYFLIDYNPKFYDEIWRISKWAAQEGIVSILQMFKDKKYLLLNFNDEELLRIACSAGKHNVIMYLIGEGADLHVLNDTSLILAAESNRMESINLMLANTKFQKKSIRKALGMATDESIRKILKSQLSFKNFFMRNKK